jgi:hypothetical protein
MGLAADYAVLLDRRGHELKTAAGRIAPVANHLVCRDNFPPRNAMQFAMASVAPSVVPERRLRQAPTGAIDFPKRPDIDVLSEAIPLFYIGRNGKGLWVVRDAEGRRGGLFLSRRSAVRFAREESEPAGCALMFLKGRLELDVMTDGVSGSFAAVVRAAEDRAPMLAALASALLTHWHGFVETISRALAGQRRNRAAIEQELFRGQYTLSSKSDDDLPVVD